mmetsp:Transcript_46378/g.121719  ORF Transcript_46378/g.121719 Transcript_46378/m.121719 type:complete len:371 (+) Transcript_46378:453-1565(+)
MRTPQAPLCAASGLPSSLTRSSHRRPACSPALSKGRACGRYRSRPTTRACHVNCAIWRCSGASSALHSCSTSPSACGCTRPSAARFSALATVGSGRTTISRRSTRSSISTRSATCSIMTSHLYASTLQTSCTTRRSWQPLARAAVMGRTAQGGMTATAVVTATERVAAAVAAEHPSRRCGQGLRAWSSCLAGRSSRSRRKTRRNLFVSCASGGYSDAWRRSARPSYKASKWRSPAPFSANSPSSSSLPTSRACSPVRSPSTSPIGSPILPTRAGYSAPHPWRAGFGAPCARLTRCSTSSCFSSSQARAVRPSAVSRSCRASMAASISSHSLQATSRRTRCRAHTRASARSTYQSTPDTRPSAARCTRLSR